MYRETRDVVALLRDSKSGSDLLSKHTLPASFLSLGAPQARAVQVVTTERGNQTQFLCAFSVTQSVLIPDAGSASGCLKGDEGVRVNGERATILRRDKSHVGSVAYRTASRYVWRHGTLALHWTHRMPDYSTDNVPVPNGTFRMAAGDVVLIKLAVAATEAQQETGLMNIHTLDPDSGMIFVWKQAVHESFWMENTYVPLSIAFLSSSGVVQEIQDMQPLTTDLHTPRDSYLYAIEVNQGFFSQNGIKVGDHISLHLGSPAGP
ncbi:MAG: DUF192 domain-containing protein [Chloroflexota bacterium]